MIVLLIKSCNENICFFNYNLNKDLKKMVKTIVKKEKIYIKYFT